MRFAGDDVLRRDLQAAVAGRYDIIRLLGRGGMGAVYLARDTLERLVAIKVILPHAFGLPGARERFRREMRTIARFWHPNIVPIYASGELDTLDYFVMMYVSGDPLSERLRQDGRMPAEEVRRVLVELADALEYAHRLGVIHRDIKPANVMIDDMTGHAFLTDFGVARTVTDVPTHSTETVAGTLGYIPPEAFSGRKVDHRADLYALGVLGYEMIAGRRPFTGDNAVQIMVQTVKGVPAALSSLAPDVPADLEAVVMRCLARNPDDRPRDARHLRGALGLREAEESTMPQDLRDMAGFGSWTLLWVTVWSGFGVRALDRPVLAIALLVIALVVPIGFGLQVAGMFPAGLPMKQIARIAFWPPKWWGMWWPRRLRRPVDLWTRLPGRARLTRIALSAFLILVPLMILLATEVDWVSGRPFVPAALSVAIGTLAAAVACILVNAWLWAKHQSLDAREIIRMLIGPTIVSRLWDSPRVSPLLTHRPLRSGPDTVAEPTRPHECVDRIKRTVQSLAGASRETGELALDTVRALRGEIEQLDLEISGLIDRSNPAAIAQLERQIAESQAMGRDGSRAAWKRERLEKELQRLRDSETRLAAATFERTQLFETQLTIWREVAALALVSLDDVAAESRRARIRGLCAG
jgi:serine/threonine-protein kinase